MQFFFDGKHIAIFIYHKYREINDHNVERRLEAWIVGDLKM